MLDTNPDPIRLCNGRTGWDTIFTQLESRGPSVLLYIIELKYKSNINNYALPTNPSATNALIN